MDAQAQVQQLGERVARHDEAIENLEGWQKTQNGALQRLADKVDKLYIIAFTAAVSAIGSLIVLLAKG